MVQRVSKARHEYAGCQVEVGDKFEVEAADVELMVAIGRIERDEADRVPSFVHPSRSADWPGTYSTRELRARRGKGVRA